MPYDQQVMLSRLQGNMPPEQILESMYGGGINPAALLQARHGMYAQQVSECPLSAMHAFNSFPNGAFIFMSRCSA